MVALVMAAGEGVRMRSDTPKVLHKICGKPILWHVMDAVSRVADSVAPILGHGRDEIAREMELREYAVQDFAKGKGTARAISCAARFFENLSANDSVLVTAGDMPLVSVDSYRALADAVKSGAAAAVLYADIADATGYGRIVTDGEGRARKIVEQKDAAAEQLAITKANASVYCFRADALRFALPRIMNHNAQGEYYLTDAVEILSDGGYAVECIETKTKDEFMGINTLVQLDEAARAMRRAINAAHMLAGVTMVDSQNTYVDAGVTIGRGTIIYPGAVIEGNTRLGERCRVLPAAHVVDARISDNCTVR